MAFFGSKSYFRCDEEQYEEEQPVNGAFLVGRGDSGRSDHRNEAQGHYNRVTRLSRFCNFSNIVAFGHNELWQTL